MSESAIVIERLSKNYREGFWMSRRKVLDAVSLEVSRGQIFGFLGANGAGKTTTIKIALGLQRAEEGAVRILGRHPADPLSRARLGYLPERPFFPLNFTANEFLDFHRGLFGGLLTPLSNSHLLELVGLPGAGSHLLGGFSKGMLQRVGIAQSLVNDPELLILDEPMSGLDPIGRRDVRNLIFDLNRKGKTIFFSSHILGDIEALCEKIAFLEKGKIKYFGRVDELLRDEEQEHEIIFKLSAEPAERLRRFGDLQPVGDRYRLVAKGLPGARAAVEACWAEGAEVIGFQRVQRTLEDALFGKERS